MEEELLELERRFWQAGGDPDFYRERFADDGRCVFGFGTLDKDATVASMTTAEPWSSFALEDPVLVDLGPEAAALTYRVRASRGDVGYEAMVSSVYTRRDGAWQLTVHHQTPAG